MGGPVDGEFGQRVVYRRAQVYPGSTVPDKKHGNENTLRLPTLQKLHGTSTTAAFVANRTDEAPSSLKSSRAVFKVSVKCQIVSI